MSMVPNAAPANAKQARPAIAAAAGGAPRQNRRAARNASKNAPVIKMANQALSEFNDRPQRVHRRNTRVPDHGDANQDVDDEGAYKHQKTTVSIRTKLAYPLAGHSGAQKDGDEPS